MEPEYIEEEIERLSEPLTQRSLSADSFYQPIQSLFSKPALTVDVSDPVVVALAKMRTTEYGAIIVTRAGQVAGMLTERDLICKVIGVIDGYEQRRAEEVMRRDPVCLRADDPILYALHNMQAQGQRHIPIVDAELRPVSVVSLKDVVRFILSHFPNSVYNVLPEPFRGTDSREGP